MKNTQLIFLLMAGLPGAGNVAYEQAFETAHHMLSNEKQSVILDSAALQKFIVALRY